VRVRRRSPSPTRPTMPLRGVAGVVRRRADPRPGRGTLRLHPLGDGEPGPRAPGRKAQAVRPAPQARTPTRGGPGQGPGPRAGDRTTPPRAVDLRDLRAPGRPGHTAQPHQRGRDPHRGGIRAAAAHPRRPRQHRASDPGPRRRAAQNRTAGLRHLARAARHRPGRAVAAGARPGRPGPARPDPPRRATPAPGSCPSPARC